MPSNPFIKTKVKPYEKYIQLYSGRSKKKTENELLIVVKTLQRIRLSLNYETLLNLVKNYNLKLLTTWMLW